MSGYASWETVSVQRIGAVAVLRLDRPDRMNAVTRQMEFDIRAAMETLGADDGVRAIVLTGNGRAFCAGMDMAELDGLAPEDIDDPAMTHPYRMGARPDFQTRYGYFPAVPKPIVAAINGAAAGLGLVFALYCDIRFAADKAVFCTAFANRGLIAEHGIAWLLPRLVGPAHSADLLLSSRRVDAAEALNMGLVNRVLPADQVLDHAIGYATDLAETVSPRSTRVMKRQLWQQPFQTLAEATADANREMVLSLRSSDFKEGVAHFVEKRKPAFIGR